MPLPAILGVGAAIAAVASGVAGVVDNYSQSRENQDNANRAREAGEQQWTGDRRIITSEWARISQGFTGEYAPAQAPREAFKTWSHTKIWEALNGQGEFADKGPVKESDINAGADGWRRLQEATGTAIDEFRREIETILTEKWGGRTATAAMQATIDYTNKATLLPLSFQMVANGIDLVQGYLGQARMSVIPPIETSGFDEFVVTGPRWGIHRSCELRLVELGRCPLLPERFGSEEAQRSVWPVGVVLDAPVLGKDLGFGQRAELLAGQEFVAESAVERFADPVLPW